MATLPAIPVHATVSAAMSRWDPRFELDPCWRKIKRVTMSLTGSSTEISKYSQDVTRTDVVTLQGALTGSADNGGVHRGYDTGWFTINAKPLDGSDWDAIIGLDPAFGIGDPFFAAQDDRARGTYRTAVSYSGPGAPANYTRIDEHPGIGFSLAKQKTGLWIASSTFGYSAPTPWDDFDRGGSWVFPISQSITNGPRSSSISSGSITVNLIT